jgi:hypothetical protein
MTAEPRRMDFRFMPGNGGPPRQETDTPDAPYLTDRRNAPLLAEPPRRLSRLTVFRLVAGPLLIPALIVAGGVWVAGKLPADDSFQVVQIIGAELGLCGGALLFLVWGWWLSRREYRLLRNGQVLLGEVTAYSAVTSTGYSEPTAGGGGEPWVQVTVTTDYAVTTPSGTRLIGRAVRVYTGAYSEPEVRPGSAVAVLYLDDETFQVL